MSTVGDHDEDETVLVQLKSNTTKDLYLILKDVNSNNIDDNKNNNIHHNRNHHHGK